MLKYPLLYWEIADGLLLGMVVGERGTLVDTNLRKLQSAFAARLRHEAEEPRIRGARLKMIPVTLRAAYRTPGRVYPAASPVRVATPAVYGETDSGCCECFLPLLNESFYYYNPNQLDRLAEHFVRDALRGFTPEDAARLLLPGPPALAEVTVKQGRRSRNDHPREGETAGRRLAKVADRYPPSRSERQRLCLTPEAAWEQGDMVRAVAEMIAAARSNVLLVGEHGVGKTAILQQAAQEIDRRQATPKTTLWRTSPQRLTAGSRYLGDWQLMCDQLTDELKDSGGVLWIEDFIDLFRTGGEGPEDSIAAYLAADLRLGRLQMVSEVTPRELDAARRLLPGFTEQFKTVRIDEISRGVALRIMEHFQDYARKYLEIEIRREALHLAYRLLERFTHQERFPGKAISFLGHCLNEAYIQGRDAITSGAVVDAFVEKSGMAELFLKDDILLNKGEAEEWFSGRIIGQEEAVAALASVVKVFKTGLSNPGRPIATLIFAGPTGVGKTASARALAQFFHGRGQRLDPLVRLDMSEFMHPSQVSRLIGSRAGADPGLLVREVRERPFCVLLLDEIEKAHPAIFDVLLNVLDEGMLADAYGRVTDFRNAVIIMTSNLGSAAQTSIGFSGKEEVDYRTAIAGFFRPEFCNRVDEIVVFHPLGAEAIAGIARKELSELARREGFLERGLRLDFSEQLVSFLAREGCHPKYGARPLQRTIEQQVVGPLSRHLLRHPDVKNCTLRIGFDGANLTIA